eukprot:TRINITY_DN7074_c0_g4_i1.p1 TRINITY_DN7074_c0_g4~~TRINITY_DN7074_c0_g4_i1.p1  ORF type:complete len:162 (+),score=13.80 TRINITY_DN7074_c0_g4_i1:73-558(+)
MPSLVKFFSSLRQEFKWNIISQMLQSKITDTGNLPLKLGDLFSFVDSIPFLIEALSWVTLTHSIQNSLFKGDLKVAFEPFFSSKPSLLQSPPSHMDTTNFNANNGHSKNFFDKKDSLFIAASQPDLLAIHCQRHNHPIYPLLSKMHSANRKIKAKTWTSFS